MSVEDKFSIDFVSIDPAGNAILTISDHLEWDPNNEHILVLQDKLNSYLGAIEGGDLFIKYPNALHRNIIIRIIFLHSPGKPGLFFLEQVKSLLTTAGYGFQFMQLNSW